MRYLCMATALLLSLSCWSQREKPVSLRFTGQFDFAVKGMGLNDAGMGVGTGVTLLAKKRVQWLTEAHSHWYIGDKQYVTDSEGKALPGGSLHSVQMGPQVFLSKSIALGATYGVAWHRYKAWNYTPDDAYRIGLTGYFGDQNNFITQLTWMQVPGKSRDINHFGIGVGYRLL